MTTYTFSPIDDGTNGTAAFGINDFGQIVGTYFDSNGFTGHGFLYNSVTYIPLNSPSGTDIVPNGINDVGQIVGIYADSSGANSRLPL